MAGLGAWRPRQCGHAADGTRSPSSAPGPAWRIRQDGPWRAAPDLFVDEWSNVVLAFGRLRRAHRRLPSPFMAGGLALGHRTSGHVPPVESWSMVVDWLSHGAGPAWAQLLHAGRSSSSRGDGKRIAEAAAWLLAGVMRNKLGSVPRRCASTARSELVLAAESVASPTAACRWGSSPLDRAVSRGTAAPELGCRTVGAALVGTALLRLRS